MAFSVSQSCAYIFSARAVAGRSVVLFDGSGVVRRKKRASGAFLSIASRGSFASVISGVFLAGSAGIAYEVCSTFAMLIKSVQSAMILSLM